MLNAVAKYRAKIEMWKPDASRLKPTERGALFAVGYPTLPIRDAARNEPVRRT